MKLDFKTIGNCSPIGKAHVFVACHPLDYNSCMSSIADEIFKQQDCSLWFLSDYTEIDEDSLKGELDLMQLIIVPITQKLLTEDSYVTNCVVPYSLEKHVPICPIVYEENLSKLLSQNGPIYDYYVSLFGELQFLDKYTTDITAIPYQEKLSSYLSKILVGGELAEKIRSAFDAYIFLSYRKKDRLYAQKLIHLIHDDKFCRNIAIWYDEFLVPGEKFNTAIERMLNKSDLFALVVTPNLINEKNYIITTEYPLANNARKHILPVEMVPTDKKKLKSNFKDIPECVDPTNNKELISTLRSSLHKIATEENVGTREHKFFIGLAYLNGIDVETNIEVGVENISLAAGEGLPAAMDKLSSMYRFGMGVKTDYSKAILWTKKLLDFYEQEYQKEETLHNYQCFADTLWSLCNIYEESNKIEDAIATYSQLENFYSKYENILKSDKLFFNKTIRTLYSLATLYSNINDLESQKNALFIFKKITRLLAKRISRKKKLDEDILLEISNFYDVFALYLKEIPIRFVDKLSVSSAGADARRLRMVIEKKSNIDFSMTFQDSIFHSQMIAANSIFLKQTNMEKLGISIDPEYDMYSSDPHIMSEELLFLSLGILEYLEKIDLKKYRKQYSIVFNHIADLWTSLGYVKRGIETYELNLAFVEKFAKDYYMNLDFERANNWITLGKAYEGINDFTKGKTCFEKAINILEPSQDENLHACILLSEAYQQMAMHYNHGKPCIEYLSKACELLEKIYDAKFATADLVMRLIDCYCCLAENYTTPDLWNSELFFKAFSRANELCQENYNKEKIGCSIRLNKIYTLLPLMEDCHSIQSVRNVIDYFKISINNCRTLLVEDSEYSQTNWIQTILQMESFNQYTKSKLNGDLLTVWQNGFGEILTENLIYIFEFSTNAAEKLLPHNYRIKFTDYVLMNGNIDQTFLAEYRTLLYIFFELLIKNNYKPEFYDEPHDLKSIITDVYNKLINRQEQGYALQLFLIERNSLLEELNKI